MPGGIKSKFKPDAQSFGRTSDGGPGHLRDVDNTEPIESPMNDEGTPTANPARPRFLIEADSEYLAGDENTKGSNARGEIAPNPKEKSSVPEVSEKLKAGESPSGSLSDVSWKQEVAQRVNSYKARRPSRPPRYPSLQLDYRARDPVETPRSVQATARITQSEASFDPVIPCNAHGSVMEPVSPETTAKIVAAKIIAAKIIETKIIETKIIEFPRSSFAPPIRSEELADPVLERPRIIEAPELLPPAPALGGILIESTETPKNERRPGFEMPLQSAGMGRRLAATIIDAVIALSALTLFAYIFWRVTNIIPPLRLTFETMGAVAGVLWAGYQYLLVVQCGTTPGLKLAKLQMSRFDGSRLSRNLRRWRVFASVLSGLSLGLGYAWCFLDEDRLCWHDRITRTYMAPKS